MIAKESDSSFSCIRFLSFLTALLLFITCYTLWSNLEGNDSLFRLGLLVVVTLAVFVLWLRQRLEKAELAGYLGWAAILAICYAAVGHFSGDYGGWKVLSYIYYAAIFPIYLSLLIKSSELGFFLRSYVAIALFFSCISLILWALGPVAGILSPNCHILNTWTGVEGFTLQTPGYFHLLYTPQFEDGTFLASRIARNTGIFTEAPMCSFALCVALFVELYALWKPRKLVLTVLTVAIATTFSTTGILLCAVALFSSWFIGAAKVNRTRALSALVAFAFLIIGAVFLNSILVRKMDSASALTRLDDFRAGFNAWMQRPIFGNGMSNSGVLRLYMSDFRSGNVGFSNSLFDVLVKGGILLLVPYVVQIIGLFARHGVRAKVFATLFLVMWVFTISSFTPLAGAVLSLGILHIVSGNYVNVRQSELEVMHGLSRAIRCQN